MKHVCSELDYCICDKQGTEPDENCPKHGYPFPPRCKECGKFMPWRSEVKAFRKLLNEFADYHPLVNYTHRILCETHENTQVKLSQPPNIKREDGTELGPCGNDGFVEIKGCISFPLHLEVDNVKETLDKLWSPSKILRKK